MNLEDQDTFIIGELKHISRTYEIEKNLVLQEMDIWKEIDKNYDLNIDKIFFDIKSDIKIIIYDSHHC
ncbi:hypothetical protein [Oceanobacillus sp. SE10311]|uniref:hypothetical protein n=1 Tax=Oceanobacillus sp. SE10311 TaxID=3098289 RepID=UPI00300DF1C0